MALLASVLAFEALFSTIVWKEGGITRGKVRAQVHCRQPSAEMTWKSLPREAAAAAGLLRAVLGGVVCSSLQVQECTRSFRGKN